MYIGTPYIISSSPSIVIIFISMTNWHCKNEQIHLIEFFFLNIYFQPILCHLWILYIFRLENLDRGYYSGTLEMLVWGIRQDSWKRCLHRKPGCYTFTPSDSKFHSSNKLSKKPQEINNECPMFKNWCFWFFFNHTIIPLFVYFPNDYWMSPM